MPLIVIRQLKEGTKHCQAMQHCLIAKRQADGGSLRDISGLAALVRVNGHFFQSINLCSTKLQAKVSQSVSYSH